MYDLLFNPGTTYYLVAEILLGIVAFMKMTEFFNDDDWHPFLLWFNYPNKWHRRIARLLLLSGVILMTVHGCAIGNELWISIFSGIFLSWGIVIVFSLAFLLAALIIIFVAVCMVALCYSIISRFK